MVSRHTSSAQRYNLKYHQKYQFRRTTSETSDHESKKDTLAPPATKSDS